MLRIFVYYLFIFFIILSDFCLYIIVYILCFIKLFSLITLFNSLQINVLR